MYEFLQLRNGAPGSKINEYYMYNTTDFFPKNLNTANMWNN